MSRQSSFTIVPTVKPATKAAKPRDPVASGQRDAAHNRSASYNYFLVEKVEAGIALRGTEVKSIREGQANLKDASLLKLAAKLRLASDNLKHALEDGKYAARVKIDLDSGIASGVTGTPMFYINGRMHDGEYDFDSMAKAIEATTKLKSGN